MGKAKIINFSPEYGHVTYQIKGNEAYNNMQANVFPLNIPSTLGVGSKGQNKLFSGVWESNLFSGQKHIWYTRLSFPILVL